MVKTIWKFWWLVSMIFSLITVVVCAIAQLHAGIIVFSALSMVALCIGLGELMDRWNVLNERSL